MSTPVGHTLVAVALARRLGVRSRAGTAAAVALANLPDIDIPFGLVLHRDAWKVHRGVTHTVAFAAATGALTGALAFASPSRGRPQAALVGAVIAGSHLVLDGLPYVKLSRKPFVPRPLRGRVAGMSIANWILDATQCAAIAWLVTRRHSGPSRTDPDAYRDVSSGEHPATWALRAPYLDESA